MRRRLVTAVLALAVMNGHAHAQSRDSEGESDEEKKTWKEIEAKIPTYPKPENLVQLSAGNTTSHRFYIDTTSLALGEDGVMRYASVVKTTGGATNVTFEGMRCETRQHKLYAVGRSDGTWVRARDPQWQGIQFRELAPHHYVLYREYFCPARTRPTRPQQAAEALKRGTGLTGGAVTVY
jgi:hypothetical protein